MGIQLEVMSANERKIIHLHLSRTRADVETLSEGTEPNRFVVVRTLGADGLRGDGCRRVRRLPRPLWRQMTSSSGGSAIFVQTPGLTAVHRSRRGAHSFMWTMLLRASRRLLLPGTLVDVGSGGGSPGIPLAAYPRPIPPHDVARVESEGSQSFLTALGGRISRNASGRLTSRAEELRGLDVLRSRQFDARSLPESPCTSLRSLSSGRCRSSAHRAAVSSSLQRRGQTSRACCGLSRRLLEDASARRPLRPYSDSEQDPVRCREMCTWTRLRGFPRRSRDRSQASPKRHRRTHRSMHTPALAAPSGSVDSTARVRAAYPRCFEPEGRRWQDDDRRQCCGVPC